MPHFQQRTGTPLGGVAKLPAMPTLFDSKKVIKATTGPVQVREKVVGSLSIPNLLIFPCFLENYHQCHMSIYHIVSECVIGENSPSHERPNKISQEKIALAKTVQDKIALAKIAPTK
ncbi:hypothetical protein AVEN_161427-1 [Araneus ventricosus]|uniref:Uncharacterized protein n=1 Tax=Araneus ventricosus TaxID=182803 RepID=A0A4Y2KBL0_ARAVE|nr:hypothetical protein AVEN_161427-1 [Araneus ventricosus]